MLIKDFLSMFVENEESGIYCAIVDSENYELPSGCVFDEKKGTLFQGISNNIPVDLLQRRFSKWDMFGNEFIFVCQWNNYSIESEFEELNRTWNYQEIWYNEKKKGRDSVDLNLQITDMAGARPEHSTVIVNFVAAIRKQLRNSMCYVFSDNVQYRFKTETGESKTVIPDASINCRTKSRRGNTFIDSPRFVMEVLSPSTEKYDRGEKKELYRQQEIDEYWIVDLKEKKLKYMNLIIMKAGNHSITYGR